MSTTLPHAPGEHGEPPVTAPKSGRGPGYYAFRALKALASLQLTVGLLATGVALVFFGTLAQIDFGIWTVVDKYFWSWVVDVPFELFRKFLNVFWKEWFPAGGSEWKGAFPFPAGKLVGALMLANLLAAHAIRFKLTWKRAGVFLIHGGLILLFVGEFVTREFAVEQQMTIEEGQSADFAVDTRNVELAFVDPSNPAFEKVAAISQRRLRQAKPGERIAHPDLPADVEVLKFMKNSDLLETPKFGDGKGGYSTFVPSPNGTSAAAYVRIYDKGGRQPIDAFAVAPQVPEQRFGAGEKRGRIALKDDGLHITDASPSGFDRVFKVAPGRLEGLAPGERIVHPDLPFEVGVVRYMPKAELVDVAKLAKSQAAGIAGDLVLVEAGEESGVAMKARGDATAAYVRLYKKGTDEVVGTHAVALFTLLQDQPITIAGAPYKLSLRNAHYQKPYRIKLNKFRFDRYEGTEKPRNYSSDVEVYEPGNPEPVRTVRIAMNEPLRYAGETFYQSSFDKTETATVLQVVKNPGQINFGLFHASIDYIACAVVSAGLLLHFGIFLVQFVLRTGRRPVPTPTPTPTPAAAPAASAPREVPFSRIFPWVVLALMGLYLLSVFGRMAPAKQPYDLDAFGRLPVLEGGRVKPLDSVARVSLRTISGREEWQDGEDGNGKKHPAIEWYLDVLSGGGIDERGPAWDHKVIRIDNETLLNELELKVRSGLRYSLKEIAPRFAKVAQAGEKLEQKVKAGGKLDTTEMKYKELVERINTIFLLAATAVDKEHNRGPHLLPPQESGRPWQSLGDLRRSLRGPIMVAVERESGVTDEQLGQMSRDEKDALRSRFKGETDRRERAELVAAHPAAGVWERMLAAHRDRRADDFNAAVSEYDTPTLTAAEKTRARVELMFNRFAPFYQCTGLYVIGFVLAIFGFVATLAERPNWSRALRRSSTLVLGLALAVHFVAMLSRMYIMDRPGVFVTNLYSSAVFIGCGCVALCLVLEGFFPLSIGNLVAAALGFATCVVAHNLATEDTLEMMQAVLDTNFWLATHVTTVTLGYTATFVAGFLGSVYILMKLAAVVRDGYESTGEPTTGALLAFGTAALGLVAVPCFFLWFATAALEKLEFVHPELLNGAFYLSAAALAVYALVLMLLRVSAEGADAQGRPLQGQVPPLARPVVSLALAPESGKILGQMMYGVIAFATLLSFVGTVLGGIWADQSWGRFWGWDPKENGAVLIVLWNALILHARWCGLVKDRGVAALAVFGNAITAWSWFGTNQLGIGLHAYGFDSRLADGCFNFWMLELALVAFGVAIPRRFWPGATRRAVAAVPALTVTEVAAPTPPVTAGPTIAPPAPAVPTGIAPTNGSPNGSSNGNGNGHTHRDKGKKKHKRR